MPELQDKRELQADRELQDHAGLQDHTALQERTEQCEPPPTRSQDGVRSADLPESGDRPARGSAADLRQRLERLPHGHPSSPYHDDGTPRPPLVRLKNLELPLPGEEREPNGGARRNLVAPERIDRLRESAATSRERQAIAPEPATPEADDRESAAWEPAARESAAWESAAREQEPTVLDHAPQQPIAQDRWATQEHGSPADDQELVPDQHLNQDYDDYHDHDDYIGDEKPATQDQVAITDDPAPVEAEQPDAKGAPDLTPEQVRIAVRALGRCRLAEGRSVFGSYGEGGLTPAMRRIEEQLEHGELAPETEKYALKSLDRFQQKLAKRIARFPGAEAADLADEIHDGIRYTFIFDADTYVDGIAEASGKLEHCGYELFEMKPSWDSDEYKGTNSRWRDSVGGVWFEVQWHTSESWETKQNTHATYEKIHDPTTPVEEVERLRDYQKSVSAQVPVPPGALQMRWYDRKS